MPYTATDGLPPDQIPKAEEITTSIISYMKNQVAEQTGAGIQHPYASGKFDVEHSKQGSVFVVKLTFYPAAAVDSTVVKPKVVELGRSRVDVVDALQVLRHYVDPTRLEYRGKGW